MLKLATNGKLAMRVNGLISRILIGVAGPLTQQGAGTLTVLDCVRNRDLQQVMHT